MWPSIYSTAKSEEAHWVCTWENQIFLQFNMIINFHEREMLRNIFILYMKRSYILTINMIINVSSRRRSCSRLCSGRWIWVRYVVGRLPWEALTLFIIKFKCDQAVAQCQPTIFLTSASVTWEGTHYPISRVEWIVVLKSVFENPIFVSL